MFPRLNVSVLFSLIIIHLIGLGGIWFTFSIQGLIACAILYPITAMGITVCYHRLLTHESFKTYKLVRYVLTFCGMTAAQGSPVEWVAFHRKHHKFSDKDGDPHSPRDGFFHAHMFWLWQKLYPEERATFYRQFSKDLLKDPFMRFWSRWYTYFGWQLGIIVLLFTIGWLGWNASIGLSLVVYGVFFRLVLVYHSTWMVNSFCHLLGYHNYPPKDDSKNNLIVAVITFGEGWHANHHADKRAANHGHHWYEPDPSYWVICILQYLRLAWDVRTYAPHAH